MADFYNYNDKNLSFHHSRDCAPDPNGFKMHTHRFNEIYYFIKGKGNFCVEGTSYTLHSGDILIMRGAESHALEISSDGVYERLVIHFDNELVEGLGFGELLEPFLKRKLGSLNHFSSSDFSSSLYRMLLESLTQQSQNPRVHIISMLIPLLNELKTAYNQKNTGQAVGNNGICKQIIDYINCHLADDLSLDKLCKLFYISKPQLCRVFKASIGSGVWEYITVKRLMAAQKLMSEGVSASNAAASCGFNDYSAFYRAYKNHIGSAPKASTLK